MFLRRQKLKKIVLYCFFLYSLNLSILYKLRFDDIKKKNKKFISITSVEINKLLHLFLMRKYNYNINILA